MSASARPGGQARRGRAHRNASGSSVVAEVAADADHGPEEQPAVPLLRDPPPPPGYSNPVEESEVLVEPFSAADQR